MRFPHHDTEKFECTPQAVDGMMLLGKEIIQRRENMKYVSVQAYEK